MRRLFLTLLLLLFATGSVNAAVLGVDMALAQPDLATHTQHCPGHHQDNHDAAKHIPGHCVSCVACIPGITATPVLFTAPAFNAALNPHPELSYTSLPSRQLQRPPSFS